MNLRDFSRDYGIAATILGAMAFLPAPVLASDAGPGDSGASYAHSSTPDGPPPHHHAHGAQASGMPAVPPAPPAIASEVRENWIAECAQRRSGGDQSRWARKHASPSSHARNECERYLDDYLAYYAQVSRPYGYGYGHGQPMAPGAGGCCYGGPVMMVPIVRQPAARPRCTETVEYIEEDVPVRPRVKRVPDKRIRVVPDKRFRVAPDKRIPTK